MIHDIPLLSSWSALAFSGLVDTDSLVPLPLRPRVLVQVPATASIRQVLHLLASAARRHVVSDSMVCLHTAVCTGSGLMKGLAPVLVLVVVTTLDVVRTSTHIRNTPMRHRQDGLGCQPVMLPTRSRACLVRRRSLDAGVRVYVRCVRPWTVRGRGVWSGLHSRLLRLRRVPPCSANCIGNSVSVGSPCVFGPARQVAGSMHRRTWLRCSRAVGWRESSLRRWCVLGRYLGLVTCRRTSRWAFRWWGSCVSSPCPRRIDPCWLGPARARWRRSTMVS